MSDRVSILAASREDRQRELEQAEGSLAKHTALIEQATAELAASNGDFETWQAIDERVRFERRQVERYQGVAEQCRQNVQCADTALANAKRETAVEALQQSRTERQALMREIAADAAAHYQAAVAALASLEPLQVAEDRDREQLRGLGQTVEPIHALRGLWLELVNKMPDTVPANVQAVREIEKAGFAKSAARIFEMLPPGWYGCPWPLYLAQTRAMLGDPSALAALPREVKVEPPKPVQVEDVRDYVSERDYRGVRYRVEHWLLSPDGREEYRLQLPDEGSLPFGVSILSVESVMLEHGLQARYVELSDNGRRVLLAPSKSLASRALGAVRNLFGSEQDQPAL